MESDHTKSCSYCSNAKKQRDAGREGIKKREPPSEHSLTSCKSQKRASPDRPRGRLPSPRPVYAAASSSTSALQDVRSVSGADQINLLTRLNAKKQRDAGREGIKKREPPSEHSLTSCKSQKRASPDRPRGRLPSPRPVYAAASSSTSALQDVRSVSGADQINLLTRLNAKKQRDAGREGIKKREPPSEHSLTSCKSQKRASPDRPRGRLPSPQPVYAAASSSTSALQDVRSISGADQINLLTRLSHDIVIKAENVQKVEVVLECLSEKLKEYRINSIVQKMEEAVVQHSIIIDKMLREHCM